MTNNVDTKFDFLRSQGYVGDSQEMELSFYMDNGATVRSLPEAEMQFLINAGYTQGATNDRWYAYLESLGYSGSVDDMLYEAWADGVLGGGGAWSPAVLFAASEAGAWYDPNDISTLWQDTAGTVPVTTAGQPVGRLSDKSGNGNHVLFSGATPPTYGVDANGGYLLPTVAASRGVCAGLSISAPYSIGIKQDIDLSADQIFYDSYVNNGGSFLFSDVAPSPVIKLGTNAAAISIASSAGVKAITGIFNGGLSSVYVNDASLSGNAGSVGLNGLSLFNIRGSPNPFASGYHAFSRFYGMVLRSGDIGAERENLHDFFTPA